MLNSAARDRRWPTNSQLADLGGGGEGRAAQVRLVAHMRRGGDALVVFARRESGGIVAEKLHHGQIGEEAGRGLAQILVEVVADHVQNLHQRVNVVARNRSEEHTSELQS